MTTGAGTEAPQGEASTPPNPPLTMEYFEEYLSVMKKKAYSTLFIPFLAISISLLLTGHFHVILDYILAPTVNLLFRILGIALGIGLGLGLATHVHDTLEMWQERQMAARRQHGGGGAILHRESSLVHPNRTLTASKSSHLQFEDETSYAALMTSAGYNVSNGIRRGQIIKSALNVNYPFTRVPPQEQNGPIIMKRQWPHLPLSISHEIGRWIEHVMRDYVAIWYCMIDASCPYENERTRRQQEQQEEQNGTTDDAVDDDTHSVQESHPLNNGNPTTTSIHRQMVLRTGPHRPLPLVTAMYHSLAIVLGNLASRMEHANVYSLVLLKFTRVLSLQLKTWRELRAMALAKKKSDFCLDHLDASSTTVFDESGNVVRQTRRVVSEMTMAKEFLLADKLHKAITFGMDIPSLLFADSSGKECNDIPNNDISEEHVLEQRLFPIMAECEQDYNRVLGHRLCRALLPRTEFASPIIRTLMTELLGGCILTPIMSIFAPDYVNSWTCTALQAVLASKQEQDDFVSSEQRTWDDDESVAGGVEVELEMDAVFQDEGQLMDSEDDDLHQSGFNEAIEVIRNPTNDDMDDNDMPFSSDEDEHHHQRHDCQTVSGDYILPLLTMAVIDLQRFVDFDLARESVDPREDGTNWDEEECQDAVRQVVLVIEAALIHGRRRQRLTKRELDKAGNDDTRRDHEGDTLLPFFSSNLSQVLMELTSDIDAFETRIAKEETRLKSDQNEEPKKKGDGPSMSCKPPASELSTLRTLIAAWLHTGQVYKTLSLLIQARQSILVPYFHEDAFLRDNENAKGFCQQLRALDGVEIMVDTTSILASSTLDTNVDTSNTRRPSRKKRNLTIQPTSPSGNSLNAQQSPRFMSSSLTQSMARRGERLSRFMSGGSNEDATEYGVSVGASMNSVTGGEGPTPRFLDFRRNENFASSLRTERDRRKESWQHVCDAMPDQSLKIVHRVKGSTVESMEVHRDLHRLSRTFYAATNKISLKDGTRRKPIEPDAANPNNGEEDMHDDEDEVLPVSLLTVEMVGAKRRIEIPDDDSSFLVRAQPRPLKSESVHVDQRNTYLSYQTFAASFEEAAVPSGSFRYSGGRYIRRCLLRYYPNDRTASIELPSVESRKTLDCRKAKDGPPTSISIGPVPPKANPLSGDFLRKHHLCQKWVPRGAAPRAGSSLLASPTMELADFHSVPRAGKSIDFVYRMSLFECPMVELSGKKFTVYDSSVLGGHRADASSIELSDASLSVALLTAGQDWERQMSERDDQEQSHDGDASEGQPDPGIEMGPDGYPIVWMKLRKKQGDVFTTDIQPYRASFVRAAMMVASTRQDAQRQCLVYCVRAGSARNATRARVDSLLKPGQRLLEFATSPSREKQSILMRDLKLGINHVDREQLRRNKLLSPRFPTHLQSLSASVEECMTVKDTGVAFPGSSPSSTVFKIRCVAIVDLLIDTEDDDVDWSDYVTGNEARPNTFREEWIVYRQFRDFNAIHKHLKSQVAITETSGTASSRLVGAATAALTVGGGPSSSERHRKVLIPSLGQANKAGALGLTQKAIEKRRAILHDYLQHLLAPNHPLRQCSEILIFLGAFYPFPDGIRVGEAPTVEPDALGRVGMVRTIYGESVVAPNAKGVSASTEQTSFSSPDKSVTIQARSFIAADSVATPTQSPSPTSRRSARSTKDDIPPSIKTKIDKVPLSKVRQAMFELIRAQFDFENASFFRNRLLTAIKTMSFAVASNTEFQKTLHNTHKSYLNPEALGELIKLGLDTVWPDGVFFQSSPALTPKQSQELAEKMKELLVNAFPDQLRSILGAEITTDGLEMLHEMLQNRVVLKSLFYMFVDLLLLEVFPEFQDFLTGGAALETE